MKYYTYEQWQKLSDEEKNNFYNNFAVKVFGLNNLKGVENNGK